MEELESIVCFDNTAIDPSPGLVHSIVLSPPFETPGSGSHSEGTTGAIPEVVPEIYEPIDNKQTIDGDSCTIATFRITVGRQHQGRLVHVLKKKLTLLDGSVHIRGGDQFKKNNSSLEPAS